MLLTNGFDPDVRVYKEALYLVGRGFSVTVLCWDRDPPGATPSGRRWRASRSSGSASRPWLAAA